MTGHVTARCSSSKEKSKRPPSWWSGVSIKHYTVIKSSTEALEQVASSSQEVLASEGLGATTCDQLVLAYSVGFDATMIVAAAHIGYAVQTDVSIPIVQNVVPVLAIQNAVSFLAVQNAIDLGSPNPISPSDKVLLGAASSLFCHVDSFVSSGVWQNNATKLEDGWIIVKGKKPKSSIPSQGWL